MENTVSNQENDVSFIHFLTSREAIRGKGFGNPSAFLTGHFRHDRVRARYENYPIYQAV